MTSTKFAIAYSRKTPPGPGAKKTAVLIRRLVMAQCYGSVLLKIPLKCPSQTRVKHQKGRETELENGKCANVTNRSSRAG